MKMQIFDFGLNLKNLRKERKWTQKKLAGQLNVAVNTIIRWERNYEYPSLKRLIELSEIYHVSLDYLVGIERNKNIVTDGLTQDQINLLNTILLELQNGRPGTIGLSPRQLDIINLLLIEFTKSRK